MEDGAAEGEYFMMRAEDLCFIRRALQGKILLPVHRKTPSWKTACFDTKDAFWHAKNVIGEATAWSRANTSRGTARTASPSINCKIIGTQPLCYCKNLKLVDCEMTGTDLAFEKSDVDATITTPVASIKNPRSGRILAPAVGEIILDDEAAKGQVVTKRPAGGEARACCA